MRTRLTDGTPVLIRAIDPADKPSLASGLGRLSPESVNRRFLSVKASLSRAELRYLTEVDGTDHHALVAIDERHPGELIAVARFVRRPADPAAAEAAIVVCDRYQRRRLGTTLAVAIADAARERGITRIEATMTSDNHAALALMQTIAWRLTDGRHRHGVHEVVAELAS